MKRLELLCLIYQNKPQHYWVISALHFHHQVVVCDWGYIEQFQVKGRIN